MPQSPCSHLKNQQKILKKNYLSHDPATTDTQRIQIIVESKYCPSDSQKTVSECNLLNTSKKEIWYRLQSNRREDPVE
jgi:hypothetical protein